MALVQELFGSSFKEKEIHLTDADVLIDGWVSTTDPPLSVTVSATVARDSVSDLNNPFLNVEKILVEVCLLYNLN